MTSIIKCSQNACAVLDHVLPPPPPPQSGGFDLGLCMLHSDAETLGLSLQLQSLTATSFVPSKSDAHCLLQCGRLDLGNVTGDLKLRELDECVPNRQWSFLRRADEKSRRLWFLWKGEEDGGGGEGSARSGGVACGCCGGCLFYDGCIERSLPRQKSESAVYATPFDDVATPNARSAVASLSKKPLGLQSLRKSLRLHSVRDVDCVVALHHGMLEHYRVRYHQPPPPPPSSSGSPEKPLSFVAEERSQVSTESSEMISEELYHTPLASIGSTEEEEDELWHSLEDLSQAGAGLNLPQQIMESRRLRLRKRASTLSYDFQATPSRTGGTTDEVDAGTTAAACDPFTTASNFQDIVPSQFCVPLVLHVPLRQAEAPPPGAAQTARSASASLLTVEGRFSSARFRTESLASVQSGAASHLATQGTKPDALRLRLPVLLPSSKGHLPAVSRKDVGKSKEQGRGDSREDGGGGGGGGEVKTDKLAKVSLSLFVKEEITAMASPLLLSFVSR